MTEEKLERSVTLRMAAWQHSYLEFLAQTDGDATISDVLREMVTERLEREAGDGADTVRAFFEKAAAETVRRDRRRLYDALARGEGPIIRHGDDIDEFLGIHDGRGAAE